MKANMRFLYIIALLLCVTAFEVKILSVDGVLPGIDTAQFSDYPLTFTYNIILRAGSRWSERRVS